MKANVVNSSVNLLFNMAPSDGPIAYHVLNAALIGIDHMDEIMDDYDEQKLTALRNIVKLLGRGQYGILNNLDWSDYVTK